MSSLVLVCIISTTIMASILLTFFVRSRMVALDDAPNPLRGALDTTISPALIGNAQLCLDLCCLQPLGAALAEILVASPYIRGITHPVSLHASSSRTYKPSLLLCPGYLVLLLLIPLLPGTTLMCSRPWDLYASFELAGFCHHWRRLLLCTTRRRLRQHTILHLHTELQASTHESIARRLMRRNRRSSGDDNDAGHAYTYDVRPRHLEKAACSGLLFPA